MTISENGRSSTNTSSFVDRSFQQPSPPAAFQKMPGLFSLPKGNLIHLENLSKNYVSQARGGNTPQETARSLQLATTDLKTLGEEFHRLNKQNPNSPETQAARAAFQRAKAATTGGKQSLAPSGNQPSTPPGGKRIGVVISFDDLNKSPNDVLPALQYFKDENIPVDFFPINRPDRAADMKNVNSNLAKIKELGLNNRLGLHGYTKDNFDAALPGVSTTTLAWPFGNEGKDSFGKEYINPQTVARGVRCGANKWGQFDQHNLQSCSIGNAPDKIKGLENATTDAITNGGVISMHFHNKDGLESAKKQIQRLKDAGAEFMFLENLAGQGKPLR